MSESKKSGEFILNNLQIFNESVVFFENSVDPIVKKGIDNCINYFSKNNHWDGEFQLKTSDDNWLRPKNWKKDDGLEAWFSLESTESDEDDNNYWVSLFCNISTNNCQAGFFFGAETKYFGGKSAWNQRIRNAPEDLDARLKDIGFKRIDGRYFLAVELNNEELAKSWMAEDPYTHDDECFAPLREALEKLKQSVPVFEAIMGINSASESPQGENFQPL